MSTLLNTPSKHGFIRRFQKCVGFRLFRLGRWQAELWYCPKGEKINDHVHEQMDSFIIYLAGKMWFSKTEPDGEYKGEPCGMVCYMRMITFRERWNRRFRMFKIRRNQPHSAWVSGRFGLFLNVERWSEKNSITSAAIDFHAT